MKNNGLVSIIIPTYNRADKIKKAINSVICQTYPEWEIIVVDDASRDNTCEIVSEYMKKNINIKYIKLDQNRGAANARNVGMQNSSGVYIAFLDSDDIWENEHLKMNLDAMDEYGVKVSYSFWLERTLEGRNEDIFGAGKSLRIKFDRAVEDGFIKISDTQVAFLKAPNYIEYACIHKVYCNHINTLVMNRDVYENIGLFDVGLITSEDDDYSFRILLKYDAVVVMKSLFIYHQGVDNLYNFVERENSDIDKLLNERKIINKFTIFLENNYKSIKKKQKAYLQYGNFNNKKKFLNACREQLGWRAFTIAYINKELDIKKSLKYNLKSIWYMHRIVDLQLLLNIISRGRIYKAENYKSYIHF